LRDDLKKIFLLGWKDLVLAFRDRAGLILMLVAPFALTLGLGFVTGGFTQSNSTGLSSVPVALVNLDEGELGKGLVDLFSSKELAGLVEPESFTDLAAARQLVDEDAIAAAVIIPSGFSASVIPDSSGGVSDPISIELYTSPSRPNSAGIVQSIVTRYLNRVEMGRIGGQVTVGQLVASGRIQPQQAAEVGAEIGKKQAENEEAFTSIRLKGEEGEAAPQFNILAYMAPGMALMFLMFTVSNGGRTLLVEKTQGTLPRLLVAPITSGQVLLGKMFGIFFTGSAQVLILILASSIIFSLKWGNPLAVLLLVLAAVTGAVGWGMLLTALVKTSGQASSIGLAVMLTFGILGGSFFDITMMPRWMQAASRITPNSWGIDGFTVLAAGGGVAAILPDIAGLLVMGSALFAISLVLFKRRGVLQG
jgi:ABC-2 type transport system permease protein